MSQIDSTYFQNAPLAIPNFSTLGNGVATDVASSNLASLNHAINVYEPKFLKMLLGLDLYDAYITGISVTVPDEKWTILRSQILNNTAKISPIANYVYYHYVNDNATIFTGVGAVRTKSDNANPINCAFLQTNAWNAMYELNIEIGNWLIENREIYEVDDIELPSESDWALTGLFAPINRYL